MKTNGSAVDEGRNPYGNPSPGGNHHQVWRLALDTPCSECGAPEKRIVIEGNSVLLICRKENFFAKATD